jgi:hypothetical protein
MLDRHPTLKMVSVESGVGWIPFILEALDYEMSENAPKQLAQMSMLPSEYFRRNLYATFWFEKTNVPALIASVGEDSVLFETDFPHPTCLYPKPLDTVAEKMSTLTPSVQRKILGENAAKLYRLYGDADLREWIEEFQPEIVLAGHVHESPFKSDGSWNDRIGNTWVFNAGHQIGKVPAFMELDLTLQRAKWVSIMGTESVDLHDAVAPARTVF